MILLLLVERNRERSDNQVFDNANPSYFVIDNAKDRTWMLCNGCFGNKNRFYPRISISQCQKSPDYRNLSMREISDDSKSQWHHFFNETVFFFSQQLSLERWFFSQSPTFFSIAHFFSQSPTFFLNRPLFSQSPTNFTVRWISLVSVSKCWFSDLSYCIRRFRASAIRRNGSRQTDQAEGFADRSEEKSPWGVCLHQTLLRMLPASRQKRQRGACFPLRGKMPGCCYTSSL